MNFKEWDGTDLEGTWYISRKIDGVRCHFHESTGHVSRKGKPLHNIKHTHFSVAEIFCGNFEKTVSKVMASTQDRPVKKREIYHLLPDVDDRLFVSLAVNPPASFIKQLFQEALDEGFEGLVLRHGHTFLKVKPVRTYDVVVTGLNEGKGRNAGRLGTFQTDCGKVNVPKDDDRDLYWDESYIGCTIEVLCMELTKNGKFRHGRFLRERLDK